MTDDELLSLMRKGNDESLRELMKKYEHLVRYVVSKVLFDETDVEETVADTFFKVWNARERIDLSKSSLKSFVCMAASGCAVDKLRRSDRPEQDSFEDCDLGVDVDYENETAKRINMKIIADCISAMRSPDREIFIERYYFRLAVKEIAAKHGLPAKRVENILYRGKKGLKKAMLKGGIIL